jgi:ferric-dicitrate binding protein FerR (iron transport regulator)
MTQNNRIWVLMSRRLSGEATPAEAEELRQLLEQAPERQYLFEVLHAYFTDPSCVPEARSDADADLEEKFQRIIDSRDAVDAPVRRLPFRRIWGYVAAVAVFFCLTWGIYHLATGRVPNSTVSRSVSNEEVLARAGARTSLLLPDGTRVWLNSNSKLRYDKEFNGGNREVVLEGEAFFEVTKNVQLPFIVHAATLDIQVLGTSFTVKSYPQDATVEATLLKGAIEVRRKGSLSAAQVILKPNEKLVFDKFPGMDSADHHSDAAHEAHHPAINGMAVDHIRTDLPDSEKVETAWMYNRLVFDGENFQELASELERWYDVKLYVRDEQLNHYHFSGAFTTETIEEALKDLQLTADFTYKINGKEIDLYAKK